MCNRKFSFAIKSIALTVFSFGVHAQQLPDAGSLMRENERQQPQLPKPAPQAVPKVPLSKPQSELRVTVKAFQLTGNALIAESELQTVLAPWIGTEAGYTELQQATDAIANEYRRRGWFARPQLPAQDISDGIIQINILEGKLGEVKIDDQGKELRISKDFVSDSMTARQKTGDPLNLDALDRSTNLLNDTPGVAVATVLSVGQNPGETDATVKVEDKPLLAGIVQLDNQGARSTGESKLTVNGNFDNPFGIGDQIALSTNASQGSQYLKVGYSLPIGSDGLRMGINTSAMQYKLIGDFKPLKAKGDTQTYGINGNYPLLRSGTRNIGMAFAVDRKNYYNEANTVVISDKTIRVGVISLNGDSLDGLGNGGITLAGISLTGGHVDLSATRSNQLADENGPKTAGGYGKFGYSLSRLQRITDQATLWATVNGQIAGKNLDSSEKMSLGGPAGVRAYPVIEGTGDDGWLTTLEARYNLMPALQVQAFYDHGHTQQSHNRDYTGAPKTNSATFKGAGLGVSWTQAGNFILRAVWAQRIGDNPLPNPINGKDGDGSYDLNRFWLTAIKFF